MSEESWEESNDCESESRLLMLLQSHWDLEQEQLQRSLMKCYQFACCCYRSQTGLVLKSSFR